MGGAPAIGEPGRDQGRPHAVRRRAHGRRRDAGARAAGLRAGAGGPVGSGAQSLSSIALDDLIGVVGDLLYAATIDGAVNVTSPSPVTSRDFAATLGGVLGRPTLLPLPAGVVRAAFGEMGEVMLLGGQRVVPERLEKAGVGLRYPALEEALRLELGRLAL